MILSSTGFSHTSHELLDVVGECRPPDIGLVHEVNGCLHFMAKTPTNEVWGSIHEVDSMTTNQPKKSTNVVAPAGWVFRTYTGEWSSSSGRARSLGPPDPATRHPWSFDSALQAAHIDRSHFRHFFHIGSLTIKNVFMIQLL